MASDIPRGGVLGQLPDKTLAVLKDRWREDLHDAGALVIGDGDEGDDIYFVLSGEARSAVFTRNGREISFTTLGPGDCFGELSAIDGRPRSASVTALNRAVIARLGGAEFMRLVGDEPEFGRVMLRLLTSKLRALSERMVEHVELNAGQRVCGVLVQMARGARTGPDSARLTPSPRQDEIAAQISARREAVAREMARLQRDGLIKRASGGLDIPSIRALMQESMPRS